EITTLPVGDRAQIAEPYNRGWFSTAADAAEYAHRECLDRAIRPADDRVCHIATTRATFGGWPTRVIGDEHRPREKRANADFAWPFSAVVVELDKTPISAMERLLAKDLIPTMVAASGGLWRDAGIPEEKAHAYYVFDKPVQKSEMQRVRELGLR